MEELISLLTERVPFKILTAWLGTIASVTGILGFIGDIFNGSLNWVWLIVAVVSIYVLSLVKKAQPELNFLQLLGLQARVSVEMAVGALGNSTFEDRVEQLADLVDQLPGNLSGSDASALLGSLSFDDRVDAIRILAPKIRRKLSKQEVEQILGSLDFDDRTNASRYLFGKK